MGPHYLSRLFSPRSIAVFGASEREHAVGTRVLMGAHELAHVFLRAGMRTHRNRPLDLADKHRLLSEKKSLRGRARRMKLDDTESSHTKATAG